MCTSSVRYFFRARLVALTFWKPAELAFQRFQSILRKLPGRIIRCKKLEKVRARFMRKCYIRHSNSAIALCYYELLFESTIALEYLIKGVNKY